MSSALLNTKEILRASSIHASSQFDFASYGKLMFPYTTFRGTPSVALWISQNTENVKGLRV